MHNALPNEMEYNYMRNKKLLNYNGFSIKNPSVGGQQSLSLAGNHSRKKKKPHRLFVGNKALTDVSKFLIPSPASGKYGLLLL